jgi:hypothetical protein
LSGLRAKVNGNETLGCKAREVTACHVRQAWDL